MLTLAGIFVKWMQHFYEVPFLQARANMKLTLSEQNLPCLQRKTKF